MPQKRFLLQMGSLARSYLKSCLPLRPNCFPSVCHAGTRACPQVFTVEVAIQILTSLRYTDWDIQYTYYIYMFYTHTHTHTYGAFLLTQQERICPQCRRCERLWVQFLGWEDPLQKEMATHSSILAWKGAWQTTVHGVTRVGHDLATKAPPLYIYICTCYGIAYKTLL